MSARGKRKDEANSGDDSDVGAGDGAPPKKTSKKSADDDNSDDIVVCELSKNRKVCVRNWRGHVVIDMREYYVKDGKTRPTKKGISLTMDQWKVLKDHVQEIDQVLSEG